MKLDITAFIRELLFSHDCVIVPGFGGFIGNYRQARIDNDTSTFFPPCKQISFNRNLSHNDGLLIKQISGTTGINYGDARDIVAEFVSGVRKKLEKGGSVVFDHIGTFVLNKEGNIEFEPDSSVNYHLDSYGLEPFQCFPLEKGDSSRIVKIPVKHSSLRKYLWRAAVIIPAAGIIFAVSLKTDLLKSKVETGNLNPLVTAEFESNKAALDSDLKSEKAMPAAELNDTINAAIIPEENIITENTADNKNKALVSENSYLIITGSFQSEENAGKQLKQLQAEGFNPEMITASNGFFRVCAMTCPDITTAMSKKDSISKIFPGAWISRKK